MFIAICDDDILYMNKVKEMIEQWGKDNNEDVSVYLFNHGDALINSYQKSKVDVIFLDIMMPLLNGMDAAREIRKTDQVVKIIFLTSSPEFALESYDVKASGYLIKPTNYERLCSLLNDCKLSIHYEPKFIIVKTEAGFQKVYYHQIECIEAQNKKVLFYLENNRRIDVLDTFVHCSKELLLNDGFYKCHRSYLVYMPAVDHFNSLEIETKSHKKIPIARSYTKDFKEAYFEYMFKEGGSSYD